MSILRLLNVDTPVAGPVLIVNWPDRIPPPGLLPIATVMSCRGEGCVFPKASCTVTWTAGLIVAPAVSSVGWAVNASLAAGPADSVIVPDMTEERLGALKLRV